MLVPRQLIWTGQWNLIWRRWRRSIINVNDDQRRDTSKIAHEYEEKESTIVRAVDKENEIMEMRS